MSNIKPGRYKAGGFLVEEPLQKWQVEALRSICDDESFIRQAQDWAAIYRQMRKDDLERPTIAQQQAALNDLQKKIAALLSAVRDLDSETEDFLIETIALRTRKGDIDLLPKEVKAHLRWLDGMIELAERRIEERLLKKQGEKKEGRKTKEAPRFLTTRVAELFKKHHIPITSTPSGNFCRMLSILSYAGPTTVKNWAEEYKRNT